MQEGKAIAHDLNPPGVADRHINVHVSDRNIARDSSGGFAAEASAAAACAGAERQGKTQPTKQQNPELCAGDSDIVGGGED